MKFREAGANDIRHIQVVRNSVLENTLSDPGSVTDQDCLEYLTRRGKGWVCEIDCQIVGFAIADLQDHNIWALFIRPEFEKQGIGRKLHNLMLDWYFEHTETAVWLSTTPGTRAEKFYLKAGWEPVGKYSKDEVKFEMKREVWKNRSRIV